MRLKKDVVCVNISITIYLIGGNLERNIRFTLFNNNQLIFRCDIYSYVWSKIMYYCLKNKNLIIGFNIKSQYISNDLDTIYNCLCEYYAYSFEKLFDLFYQKLITITE